jgi:hypothetical protein
MVKRVAISVVLEESVNFVGGHEMQEGRIDEYDLVEGLANGVRNDLFWVGLIAGGVVLLFSLLFIIDNGWHQWLRDLPAYLILSLLVAIIAGGLMMKFSIPNQLKRIAKARGCKRELIVWFSSDLTE